MSINYNKIEVGKRLEEIREKHDLKQKDIASAFGTEQSNIHKYEKGKAKPTPEFLFWFAGEFGVTIDYLLTGQTPEEYGMKAAEAEKKYGLGPLSPEETELVRLFRDAPLEGKAGAMGAAKAVLELYKSNSGKKNV